MKIRLKVFLEMLQFFEQGEFLKMADLYNNLMPIDKIKIGIDCFEKNIYNINANTRIQIMAKLLQIDA